MNKIAILGASSHIAKGLIFNFLQDGDSSELVLFARSVEKVGSFLSRLRCADKISVFPFSNFGQEKYSAIINCVGFGNPKKLTGAGPDIFEISEKFDTLALDFLKNSAETLYINLSSGAVYGDFDQPAGDDAVVKLSPNHVADSQYYGIAKFYTETKHRAFNQLSIVDLRIFGYFSRFIDLDAGYLLGDIAKCIHHKTVLMTRKEDFVRDYVHPRDLYQLIVRCIEAKALNCAFDVFSKIPATKFEILQSFQRDFGLQYQVVDSQGQRSPTGEKSNYYSVSRHAETVGYMPEYSSLEGLSEEMGEFCKLGSF
jgi:nucleoside-diphosphate-sugar epimerase